MKLGGHCAEPAGDHDFAACSAVRQLVANERHADARVEHVDAGLGHDRRDRAAACHSDLVPGRPVDCDAARCWTRRAEIRRHLAKEVVRGAVVGLSGVAETSGDRAERDRGTKRQVADCVQQGEPAVALHVEDEVVFCRALVAEPLADLESAGVQQHVDVSVVGADGVDSLGDCIGI